MAKDITSIVLNPTRMRIIQALVNQERITASEICEKLSDVPRTTLYRHISILIDANILNVVEEKKIRGSMERTLSLNVTELNRHNTKENATQNAFRFFMNTYAKFDRYFNNTNHASRGDKIFFTNTVMMMTDYEFDQFLSELQALVIKYQNKEVDGRKLRDISIISAPPGGVDDE